jgi:hypothetical protein
MNARSTSVVLARVPRFGVVCEHDADMLAPEQSGA